MVHAEITMGQTVIISQISPKEGRLTPYFKNCQRILLETVLKERDRLERRLFEDVEDSFLNK